MAAYIFNKVSSPNCICVM